LNGDQKPGLRVNSKERMVTAQDKDRLRGEIGWIRGTIYSHGEAGCTREEWEDP